MTLREFVAQHKQSLLADLEDGRIPEVGRCDEESLAEALKLSTVRVGKAEIRPNEVSFEFILTKAGGESTVHSIVVDTPERVVFMPVPSWVVETIWQGEISGSHQFESDAQKLVEQLQESLTPEQTAELFTDRKPVGRS